MKNCSLWLDDVKMSSFPKLSENIKTNVLIIGGGITGILCAYELKKRNIDAIVLEQDTIGKGISKNTTAFITAQHELLYQDIVKNKGYKAAKSYLKLNLKAIDMFKELGRNFDIDYQNCSSIMYSSNSDSKILKEKQILDNLGYKTELIETLPFNNLSIKLGIKFNNQGKLHPLKLINNLAKELIIYEHTRVENLKGNKAYANGKIIEFKKVIIASHYPLVDKVGLYFLKLFQKRSYVVAIKHPPFKDTYCSIDDNGYYFRCHDNYLLIGGNDRNTGKQCECTFIDKIKKEFKFKTIEYSWSNQDIVTLDQIPYIGKYDYFHKNWYVATGFNLWGFTWAMVSSFVLADMIEGKAGVNLLDPQRFWLNKQLFINIKNTLKNMLTFRKPRCTHLGVALRYNNLEHTFECPAHGSRFALNGNVLDGPAKKNLNTEKIERQATLENITSNKKIQEN